MYNYEKHLIEDTQIYEQQNNQRYKEYKNVIRSLKQNNFIIINTVDNRVVYVQIENDLYSPQTARARAVLKIKKVTVSTSFMISLVRATQNLTIVDEEMLIWHCF